MAPARVRGWPIQFENCKGRGTPGRGCVSPYGFCCKQEERSEGGSVKFSWFWRVRGEGWSINLRSSTAVVPFTSVRAEVLGGAHNPSSWFSCEYVNVSMSRESFVALFVCSLTPFVPVCFAAFS